MKKLPHLAIALFFIIGCNTEPEVLRESWIEKPVSQWPVFALTNEISFDDTTYVDIANSFLINTGYDTLGVSCKHFFMLFENQLGLQVIYLGDEFNYWKIYPKKDKEKVISVRSLINSNSKETIGRYNTMKVRDWLLFELKNYDPGIYPLKIRYTPIEKNEVVYAVGWGIDQKDNSMPALTKLKCYKNLGDYYFTQTISTNVSPGGRSGSPVIDKNGYLVGIVSGAEGKLGVIGSVNYLMQMFDTFGIQYKNANN